MTNCSFFFFFFIKTNFYFLSLTGKSDVFYSVAEPLFHCSPLCIWLNRCKCKYVASKHDFNFFSFFFLLIFGVYDALFPFPFLFPFHFTKCEYIHFSCSPQLLQEQFIIYIKAYLKIKLAFFFVRLCELCGCRCNWNERDVKFNKCK